MRGAAAQPTASRTYAETAPTTREGPLNGWLTALLEGLAALGGWRYAVAFLGMFCETSLFVGLLVPGDTIVLFVATANRDALEWLLVLLSVIAGSLGGESVGFAIGRLLGPRLRSGRLGRRIGEHRLLRADRLLERRGGVAIFVSRFLPVMHALVPVTVGASAYPYRRFLAWSAPACLLWALVYVSVGTAAGSSYRVLAGDLHFAGWLVLGGIALFAVAAFAGRRLLHRLERP